MVLVGAYDDRVENDVLFPLLCLPHDGTIISRGCPRVPSGVFVMNRRWMTVHAVCCLAAYTTAFAGPTVSVIMNDPVLLPGQSSSYLIWLDATGFPNEVSGMLAAFQTLPSVIQLPLDGHDIFSSETDTSGVYLEGFLQGESVLSFNKIDDLFASVAARTLQSDQPWPLEPNDKVVRYDFTVASDAQPGVYTITLIGANLGYFTGPLPPPFTILPILSEDLFAGSFEVVPDVQADFNSDGYVNDEDYAIFEPCLVGPNGSTPVGCDDADFDANGAVDLDDYAGFQRCYTGVQVVSDPNCAD